MNIKETKVDKLLSEINKLSIKEYLLLVKTLSEQMERVISIAEANKKKKK